MNPPLENEVAGFEHSDGSVRAVVISVGLLLVLIAGCFAGAFFFLGDRFGSAGGPPQASFRYGVVDNSSLSQDWRLQEAQVHDHLETYGWIDASHEMARIPISRAMEILAAKDARQRAGKQP